MTVTATVAPPAQFCGEAPKVAPLACRHRADRQPDHDHQPDKPPHAFQSTQSEAVQAAIVANGDRPFGLFTS